MDNSGGKDSEKGLQSSQTPKSAEAPLILLTVIFSVLIIVGLCFLTYINQAPIMQATPMPPGSPATTTPAPRPTSIGGYTFQQPLPTADTLNKQYLLAREAIRTRNYTLFSSVASSRILSYLDHPDTATSNPYLVLSNITSLDTDGNPVEAPVAHTPSELFSQLSAYEYSLWSPDESAITPARVEYNTILSDDGYPESVLLFYSTTRSSGLLGNGTVRFDYDGGQWKYGREEWDLTPTSTSPKGDAPSPNGKTIDITSTTPFTVTRISRGETVTWKSVYGMVFTYASSAENWDSGFLRGEDYTREFNSTGQYFYFVNLVKPFYAYKLRGVVVVE